MLSQSTSQATCIASTPAVRFTNTTQAGTYSVRLALSIHLHRRNSKSCITRRMGHGSLALMVLCPGRTFRVSALVADPEQEPTRIRSAWPTAESTAEEITHHGMWTRTGTS